MKDKKDYAALSRYYHSAYWNRVRGKVLYQRGGRCEQCRSTDRLTVHHLNYSHLFHELDHLGDLALLCIDCHAKEERKKRGKALFTWPW